METDREASKAGRRRSRRSHAPLWLVETIDTVRLRSRLLVATAAGVILVGTVAALLAPSVIPPVPIVGAALGFAAVLLGLAVAIAVDAADLRVRGPRHVRAAGGELVAILPPDADPVATDQLAIAALDARDDDAKLLLGLAAVGGAVDGAAALTDALAVSIAAQGVSVLRVDLARGPTDEPGLFEVANDEVRLARAASFESDIKLAWLPAGRNVAGALGAIPAMIASLPRDLDVLLLALPAATSRQVVRASASLDHVLLVAERGETSRVDLIASLDAFDAAGCPAQVVLIDGRSAKWLGIGPGGGDGPVDLDDEALADDEAVRPDDEALADDEAVRPDDEAVRPDDVAVLPDDVAVLPDDEALSDDEVLLDDGMEPDDDGSLASDELIVEESPRPGLDDIALDGDGPAGDDPDGRALPDVSVADHGPGDAAALEPDERWEPIERTDDRSAAAGDVESRVDAAAGGSFVDGVRVLPPGSVALPATPEPTVGDRADEDLIAELDIDVPVFGDDDVPVAGDDAPVEPPGDQRATDPVGPREVSVMLGAAQAAALADAERQDPVDAVDAFDDDPNTTTAELPLAPPLPLPTVDAIPDPSTRATAEPLDVGAEAADANPDDADLDDADLDDADLDDADLDGADLDDTDLDDADPEAPEASLVDTDELDPIVLGESRPAQDDPLLTTAQLSALIDEVDSRDQRP